MMRGDGHALVVALVRWKDDRVVLGLKVVWNVIIFFIALPRRVHQEVEVVVLAVGRCSEA